MKIKILLFALILIAAVPFSVRAVDPGASDVNINPTQPKPDVVINPPKSTTQGNIPTLQNPLKATNITDALLSLVDLFIAIGVIIAVFAFIFVGFKFVAAQGSDAKLTDAKDLFLKVAIGTAILISSKVIVTMIENTLTSAGVVKEGQFTNKP